MADYPVGLSQSMRQQFIPQLPLDHKYAEAALEPAGLQDLVDGLGDILKADAGLDLRLFCGSSCRTEQWLLSQ